MATAITAGPDSAQDRGDLLRRLGLMDLPPEPDFDELVELATNICGTPLAAMTLLDETTQLMKARVGFKGARTIPIGSGVCQYTVQGTTLMMVEDLDKDERFQIDRTPQEMGIRFYAGVPLSSSTGFAIGALCVMDVEPSTLTPQQQRALEIVGHQMSAQIQLREHANAMESMAVGLERGQRLFSNVLNTLPVGVYLKDTEGRFRFYNRKLAERFAIDRYEWLGKTSYDLWDKESADEIAREERAVLQSGKPHESVVSIPNEDGSATHWKSFKMPCEDTDGELVLACCSIDMTIEITREEELKLIRDELEEANRKLNILALNDALTGLWNRRAFDAQVEVLVMTAQRSKQPMSLLLIDADDFKSVNDRFGHPYGDTALRNIAQILNRTKRAEDLACRFGGEEFAVLLPGCDLRVAKLIAGRILSAMHAFPWENEPVTASIGVAMCSETCSSDELVDDADAALYCAKREGKNRAVAHTAKSAPTRSLQASSSFRA